MSSFFPKWDICTEIYENKFLNILKICFYIFSTYAAQTQCQSYISNMQKLALKDVYHMGNTTENEVSVMVSNLLSTLIASYMLFLANAEVLAH